MSVTVRLFALLRELKGTDRIDFELAEGETIGGLFDRLFPDPEAQALRGSLAFARNTHYVGPEVILADGDEVAFIPPLGGGSSDPRVHLSFSPLELEALIEKVVSPERGGLTTFTGLVRNSFESRAVTHLEYEAYEPMALREMSGLCDEIETRWPGCAVAMSHRLGRLEIGEAAVHIVVASPHRAAAFEACRFGIDELKLRVPIFKKECYADGSVWKDNQNG
jgi:molybdopterin synthase catalytic subunit/molybdopterin converting factor small subunit